MTRTDLKTSTRKELAALARHHRIAGWHSMRKAELIDALARHFRQQSRAERSVNRNTKQSRVAAKKPASLSAGNGSCGNGKQPHLSQKTSGKNGSCRLRATTKQPAGRRADRLFVEPMGPHWLQVHWTVSSQMLQRAEAALGTEWRLAVPVLRLFDLSETTGTSTTKRWSRDVEIEQPLDHWYVPVPAPGRSYRLELGYRTPSGRFFMLVRSPRVKTPRKGTFCAATPHAGLQGRATNYDGWKSISPQDAKTNGRQQSAGGNAVAGKRESSAETVAEGRETSSRRNRIVFDVDAEIVLHGQAPPEGELTLLGEAIPTDTEGRFAVRFAFEEGRQVIPASYVTPCGSVKRTIVLAIDRNTKYLAPQSLDETL